MTEFDNMKETIVYQANKIRELEAERDMFRRAYNVSEEKIRKLNECVNTYEDLIKKGKEENRDDF